MDQFSNTRLSRLKALAMQEDTPTVEHHPDRAMEPLGAILYDEDPKRDIAENVQVLGAFRSTEHFDRFISALAQEMGGKIEGCTIFLPDGSQKAFKRIIAGDHFETVEGELIPKTPNPVAIFHVDSETGLPIAQEAHESAEDFLALYQETAQFIKDENHDSLSSSLESILAEAAMQDGDEAAKAIWALNKLGFIVVPLSHFESINTQSSDTNS